MSSQKSKIDWLDVDRLRLDPKNPRLPEEMDSSVSKSVVQYYLDNYVLDELIQSFRENGYFEQEPMIVIAAASDDETFYVLEGNRRLAALIQLLGLDGQVEHLPVDPPTKTLRKTLQNIPCLVTESREAVATHLGFRHIGGIKPWPPEAKARFVATEVRRYAESGASDNPFARVARMVGTSAQSVRLAFYAYELLNYAKSEHQIETTYVANHRFGVWLRAMSSEGVKERIGIELPKTPDDLDRSLQLTKEKWIRAVVGDLSRSGGQSPILNDSRDVTVYGHVLANARAYSMLCETRDLGAAAQLVSGIALAEKIVRVEKRLPALIHEAEHLEDPDSKSYEAAVALRGKARTLVSALRPDDDG